MAPHGKELSEDLRIRIVALHKDGLHCKKLLWRVLNTTHENQL